MFTWFYFVYYCKIIIIYFKFRKILKKCYENTANICLTIEKNIRAETLRVKIENGKIIQINKTIPIRSMGHEILVQETLMRAIGEINEKI